MNDYYLEFEKPIKEIDSKILELETEGSSKNASELSSLKTDRESTLKEVFSNLKNQRLFTK